jgi:hypothetical protein
MALALLSAGLSGACKKEGGSSAIAALVPGDTAAKLSKDLMAFAEELPGDVEAFGYLELGQPLEQMISNGDMAVAYREMIADLSEMTARRWGLELRKLSGVGVVVHQRRPLLVVVGPSAPPRPGGELVGEVMLGQLGKLSVLGETDAVAALLASAKQGKRLHQTRPAWLKSALVHAAGNAVFFSGALPPELADDAPLMLQDRLREVTDATATIGATGLAVYLSCKPGTAASVHTFLEGGLAMARTQMDKAGAMLPQGGAGPLLGVLLRHYGQALWKSIAHKASGDEVAVKLGWHAPELPKLAPIKLAERVVAPGELAVAQLNFGAPLSELLVGLTDVLEAPLDRAALRRELAEALVPLVGVPGLDPRGATGSVSAAGVLVSVHNAPLGTGAAGSELALFGGAVEAVTTPWGLAFSPQTAAGSKEQLVAAATAPQPGVAGLGDVKLLDADDAFLRVYADLTLLPPGMPLPASLPKIDRVAVVLGMERFAAEVTAPPGGGKALADWLKTVPQLAMPAAMEAEYRDRAKQPAATEVMLIVQRSQRRQLEIALTPAEIDGDRLRFETKFPPAQMQLIGAAMAVGVASAIAIPAFLSYQMKAAASMQDLDQLPADPSQDPATNQLADPVPGVDPAPPAPPQ